MIGYLRGLVLLKTADEVLLDVRDVGYRVRVGKRVLSLLMQGDSVELFIYTHVREDALELYGFENRQALHLFEKVIGVSGIGPKIGMAVVESGSVGQIERAVVEADVGFFTRVPGIGKKGAQRLIIDLKGKIKAGKELDLRDDQEGDDVVVDALVGFGYPRVEVEMVLAKQPADLDDEARIRQALRSLGR